VSLEGETLRERLLTEAITIHDEDRLMCRKIGELGATLLANCTSILTHCNAGGLATSERGTALAPIYQLHEWGKTLHVFADETRPLMQGARLTAWELSQAGIPVTVCTDSMAGSLMRQGRVESVIVGADRIAVCGDVANKIGTYPLAVLARFHGIPFYVAAPSNTFDLSLASGDEIPIEQRATTEITVPFGCPLPPNVQATNYAFDVTPATLVSAFITERGVIHSPNASKITELIGFGNK
jgi:methylthioribose-1-phosphate isomerase